MDIADWRKKIDDLDRRLVQLLNERAQCAHEIGKLKRNSSMPIYEPNREKIIYENIARRYSTASSSGRSVTSAPSIPASAAAEQNFCSPNCRMGFK